MDVFEFDGSEESLKELEHRRGFRVTMENDSYSSPIEGYLSGLPNAVHELCVENEAGYFKVHPKGGKGIVKFTIHAEHRKVRGL